MRRRTKWFLIAGLCLAGVVACVLFSGPREPRYQNRPLGAWLEDLNNSNYETQRLARTAIAEMGPAAVPFLTNSLAQRDSVALRLVRKNLIPRRLLNVIRNRVRWESPVMESRNAALALQTLGPNASNAIPALIAALRDPSPLVSSSAAFALGSTGTNALRDLERRLDSDGTSDGERIHIFQAFTMLGTNAAPVSETPARFLNSQNFAVSFAASQALSRMGVSAIPAITNLLVTTNTALLTRALNTLAQMGALALPATNAFMALMNEPNPAVRLAARQTLASASPPPQFAAVWAEGLRDADIRIVDVSLRQLTMFPTNVRAFAADIALVANTSTNLAIRGAASNALTLFKAWPK